VPASSPLDPAALEPWLTARQALWSSWLRELVEVESPSGDAAAIGRCAQVVADWLGQLVGPEELELGSHDEVPYLRMRTRRSEIPGVLLLAHLDTVWATGSFQPLFEISEGRASGPGVFDMKGGVVIAVAAMAAMRELGLGSLPVTLLCTGDEEVGSRASRQLIEEEARRSEAVLVLEPPAVGAVKVARKGVGDYLLRVKGRAAHAGLEPERGINSVVELAALVGRVAAAARPELGTTVTPTVFHGGLRTNVVPAVAELRVDVRFSTSLEAQRVDAELRTLTPSHPEAVLELLGGANRPPLEAEASENLFKLARTVAAGLGWPELRGATVGGGSDGNFTAAIGIPTLDGMGIVGGNAHSAGEWADPASIPARAALLAGCIQAIEPGGAL